MPKLNKLLSETNPTAIKRFLRYYKHLRERNNFDNNYDKYCICFLQIIQSTEMKGERLGVSSLF